MLVECRGNLVEQCIIGEGAQKLEMTFAAVMHAGKDRIHDAKWRLT